ncbi:MAG TPA: hypothetical protein VFO31_09295, partial [Vicinamibacterales bacterium]|nr:hypothetical protein [Vicinamibacterales bacterium]
MTTEITRMTDETLLAETRRVAELERRTTAGLLALLIELENRSLHLTLGYSSMFVYCTRALLLSEQAAFKRITAARVARRYPIILQGLAEGELTLSSIKILAPHLTDENVDVLVDAARRKSTREVEQLIAAAQPQPDVPASVRALPAPKTSGVDGVTHSPGLLDEERAPDPVEVAALAQPASPASVPRSVVAPIAPRR